MYGKEPDKIQKNISNREFENTSQKQYINIQEKRMKCLRSVGIMLLLNSKFDH